MGVRGTEVPLVTRGENSPSSCERRGKWSGYSGQTEDSVGLLTKMKTIKLLTTGMVAQSVSFPFSLGDFLYLCKVDEIGPRLESYD